ncbi:MAG: cyclic nucleotide-binding domain-containing protein [Spirochaetes bacterium]|nr:cyclic nucleotide-binding domain-containing protein [Spirochaetota bacterium]
MTDDFDNDLIKFGFEGSKGISDELLEKYGKKYNKNQIIINEGDASDDVYILYEGSCFVLKRVGETYKVLNIINPGEVFGEMAVFNEKIRSATVAASEDNTICLKFPKDVFINIFRIHPRWVDKILGEMSERIVEMVKKL